MGKTTLDDYNFRTVNNFMKDLSENIQQKTHGNIGILVITIDRATRETYKATNLNNSEAIRCLTEMLVNELPIDMVKNIMENSEMNRTSETRNILDKFNELLK